MATTKAIKYAAPYRSKTFNDQQSQLIGMNGVVTGAKVTTVGFIVYIQPGVFAQNGLFTTTDYVMSTTVPTGLTAPYSVVITVSSSVENPAEVITPTFTKRPEDVTVNSILIADWDGAEWIARPKIQIYEHIVEDQERALHQDLMGITDGMDVATVGPSVIVYPGTLTDRQGAPYTKSLNTSFTPVGVDVDGLNRIDDIVYRRPDDSQYRVGMLEYVVGQTFNPTDTLSVLNKTQIGNTAYTNTAGKVLVDTGNNRYFLYIQDYGSRATLMLRGTPEANTPVVAAVSLAVDVAEFDAVINPAGTLDIVYTRGTNVYYKRTDLSGGAIFAETAIASHSVAVANPKVVTITAGTAYFIHAVYVLSTSPSDHQIYYIRLSSANTVETQPASLLALSTLLTSPSIDKDDGDSLLFLAYRDQSTGRLHYCSYDAGTATFLTPPAIHTAPIEVQNDTYQKSTSTVLASTGGIKPIIKRADNKDIFVFWLHPKASGYGVAVYNATYLSTFGHKAAVIDMASSGELVALFDVSLDKFNAAHFVSTSTTGVVTQASYYLEDLSEIGISDTIDSTVSIDAVCNAFDTKGSLVSMWSSPSAGTTVNGNPASIIFFGPGTYGGFAIGANEFVLLQTTGNPLNPGYNDLPQIPSTGDTIVVSDTPPDANSGTYLWTGDRVITVVGTPYTVVATNAAFSVPGTFPEAQFLVNTGTSVSFAKTTSGVGSNLRGFRALRTDVFLAHRRSSDAVLSVSGRVLDETPELTRVYELLSCMPGGGGTASWNANTLIFNGAIYVNFYNRKTAYLIPANAGVVINNNQVAYVQVPDADSAATLTLQVTDFGSGILDRHGRNVLPLFWNVGGLLYSRFAPYRLEPGESISLGDQISDQMLSWLGAATSNPIIHTYTSTTHILNTDSHETAIGKIDANIGLYESGTSALALASTSHVITFATPKLATTYSVQVTLSNVVDADPLFQPILVTGKTLTNMTVSWNAPLDSVNYVLEYSVKSV